MLTEKKSEHEVRNDKKGSLEKVVSCYRNNILLHSWLLLYRSVIILYPDIKLVYRREANNDYEAMGYGHDCYNSSYRDIVCGSSIIRPFSVLMGLH